MIPVISFVSPMFLPSCLMDWNFLSETKSWWYHSWSGHRRDNDLDHHRKVTKSQLETRDFRDRNDLIRKKEF